MSNRRRDIDEDTQSIGRGALTLDVADLRVPGHQWTDDEINRCWDAISAIYGVFAHLVMMRNSDMYLVDNIELNDPLYIGPTADGPAMRVASVRKLRKQGMRTIAEVIAATSVPNLEDGVARPGFHDISLDALPPAEREIAIRARKVGKSDRRAVDRRAKPRRVSDRSRLATGNRHKR